MKFCTSCQKNVKPRRHFSLFAFFILLGVFYIPFYLLQSKKCPSCGLHKWGKPIPAGVPR